MGMGHEATARSTPSGPPPFGASTLRDPPNRGPTFCAQNRNWPKSNILFGTPPFWALPFGTPHFVFPKFNIQKLAEVYSGRSPTWPKSKLVEVELAELEKRSLPKSKLAEVDRARFCGSGENKHHIEETCVDQETTPKDVLAAPQFHLRADTPTSHSEVGAGPNFQSFSTVQE